MNNMQNLENRLLGIEKMLAALLKSGGHYHYVDGYAWGYTSNGDAFVTLYPSGEWLKHKVCRVYPHDFRKLPDTILVTKPDAGPEEPGDRDKAQAKGIYHTCALMGVVTHDGKETQMGREKRFSDVLWVAGGTRNRPPQPQDEEPEPEPEGRNVSRETFPPAEKGVATAQVQMMNERGALCWGDDVVTALACLAYKASAGRTDVPGQLTRKEAEGLLKRLGLHMQIHQVGSAHFGPAWADKLEQGCLHYSNQRTRLDWELSTDEARTVLANLRKQAAVAVAA